MTDPVIFVGANTLNFLTMAWNHHPDALIIPANAVNTVLLNNNVGPVTDLGYRTTILGQYTS